MQYYFFVCVERGGLLTESGAFSEPPCMLGLTTEEDYKNYEQWLLFSELEPKFIDVFSFTAPAFGWLEDKAAAGIWLQKSADQMIAEFESDDRFARPDDLVYRIRS